MFFWIPLVLCLLLIAAGIIGSAHHKIDDDSALVLVFILPCAIAVGGVLAVVGGLGSIVDNSVPRVLHAVDLQPVDSSGHYAKVLYTSKGELITYNKLINGVSVPYTVLSDDVPIVSVKSGTTPQLVTLQTYVDDPWLWPWIYEGTSNQEIHVSINQIVQQNGTK